MPVKSVNPRDPNYETLPKDDYDDQKKTPNKHLAGSYMPLISPDDKELVTNYLFLIWDQMKVCEF